jgi:hypothetical protein
MTGAEQISEIRRRADRGDFRASDVPLLLNRLRGLELVYARAFVLPQPARMSEHIRRRWEGFLEVMSEHTDFDSQEIEE